MRAIIACQPVMVASVNATRPIRCRPMKTAIRANATTTEILAQRGAPGGCSAGGLDGVQRADDLAPQHPEVVHMLAKRLP